MAVAHSTMNFLRQPVQRGLIPSTIASANSSSTSTSPTTTTPKAQILWIGCSSSSLTEMETLGVRPEEIIVHRNIGNLLSNDDLSTSSSVEYALRVLKVKHIVVCGHYGCNFVNVENTHTHDPADRWLRNVNELYETHKLELDRISGSKTRNRRFAELHAWTQARDLLRKENVSDAVRKDGLKVHSFMFDEETNGCVELMPVESTTSASKGNGNARNHR